MPKPKGNIWATRYLTFEAVTNCRFNFSEDGLSYSLDDGITWTELPSETYTPVIPSGGKIMFKGELLFATASVGIGQFGASDDDMQFNVMGNIMSLLYGDNFISQTDFQGMQRVFTDLFAYCYGLTYAHDMILPATTLTYGCYYNMFNSCTSLTTAPELPATTLANRCYYFMFNSCTSLTTAPELPATTLANYCYDSMFYGCTSLNYIKAMFTTTPSASYTRNWVQGVSATGTFVKNSAATWNVTGDNGIPSGWTVETASA